MLAINTGGMIMDLNDKMQDMRKDADNKTDDMTDEGKKRIEELRRKEDERKKESTDLS